MLFLFSIAGALESAEKKEGKASFASALGSLSALGLPDVSKGEYVNLSVYNFQAFVNYGNVQLSGNAWRLPSVGKEGEQTFVTLNGDVLRVNVGTKDLPSSLAYGRGGSLIGLAGQAEPADFKKDCDAVLAAAEQRNEDSNYVSPDPLIFAAFASQCGFTSEANRLCEISLSQAKSPHKTVTMAISLLANARYDSALGEFSRNADWIKFAEAIAAIRSDCGANWSYSEAAALLESRLRAQATKKGGDSAVMKKLSPEDRKYVAELQRKAGAASGDRFVVWLFPNVHPAEGEQEPDSFSMLLQKRGMKAIPLLAMLEKEGALLPTVYVPGYSPLLTSALSSMMTNHYGKEKSPAELLEAMPRPLSVSDVPKLALRSLLVGEERYNPGSAPASLSDWYKEHPFKSADEAAWYFLKGGEHQQLLQASRYLVGQGQRAKIEEYLLSSLKDQSKLNVVMAYVSDQKQEAAPFAKKISELIKQKKIALPEGYGSSFNQVLKQLDTAVQSLEDNMMAVGTGRVSPYEIDMLVQRELGKKKFRDGLTLVVKTAAMQPQAIYRRKVLSWTLALPFNRNENEITPPEVVPVAELAKEWNELLDDTRETVLGETVGGYAAFTLEQVSAGMDFSTIHVLYAFGDGGAYLGMSGDWFKWLAERGRARLAGKPVPSRKEALTLPEEQKKKLVAEAEKLSAGQLDDWLKKIGPIQKLSLIEGLENKAQLVEKINAVTGKISEVQVEGTIADPAAWSKLKGATLDRALVDKVFQLYAGQLKKTGGTVALISRASILEGWKLRVVQQNRKNIMTALNPGVDPNAEAYRGGEESDQDRMVAGIQSFNFRSILELNGDGSISADNDDDERGKEFYESLKGFQTDVGTGLVPKLFFVLGIKKTMQPAEDAAPQMTE